MRGIDIDQDKSGPIWIDIEELEEANTQTFWYLETKDIFKLSKPGLNIIEYIIQLNVYIKIFTIVWVVVICNP